MPLKANLGLGVFAILIAAIIAGLSLAGLAGGWSASSSEAGTARPLGPLPVDQTVDFSILLRAPGERHLHRYLRRLYDPASPGYRRFISAAEFGRRFGPPAAEVDALRRRLGRAGVTIVGSYPQRTALRVRATAGDIESLFATRIVEGVDRNGRHFRAPAARPRIPGALRSGVTGIAGLDNRPRERPAAAPLGGLKPADVATAYDIAPLHARGLRGQGVRVAVVSLDSFHPEDIAAFDRQMKIDGPAVTKVPVAGGTEPGEGQTEVLLDLEVIRGIAPQARILDYEGRNGSVSIADIVDRIVADGEARTISISWGHCDALDSVASRRRADRSFEAAAAAGVNVLAASGDSGAYECQRSDPSDDTPTLSWPAASPWVIAVGGTLLSVRDDDTYLDEAGWEDVLSGGGSGGGTSAYERQPGWQTGPGVANPDSDGGRQVPDVSGPADPDSGFQIVSAADGVSEVGGTSAAAPFWAGTLALTEQLARREGVPRLGYLNPTLYRLAAGPRSPFHDVTRGGNRLYDAGPGWDYATGLGSPDAQRLAGAIASRLAGDESH